jgi:hypothetical protein
VCPHSLQNLAPGRLTAPHDGQPDCNELPHSLQKRAPLSFSLPQLLQVTKVAPSLDPDA